MLLPFLAWVATGIFFFFKPGYQAAYQPLSIKLYPVKQIITLPEQHSWLEVRQLTTVLGPHLLVRDQSGWQQLDVDTFEPRTEPTNEQLTRLISQAISDDQERYGEIIKLENSVAETSTGVKITFNWRQMTLRQRGVDTELINTLYDIHYLRWTGHKLIDQYLGVIGLLCVAILALIGTWMSIKRAKTFS